MAAASWARSQGAGSQQSGAVDVDAYASSLAALQNLAAAMPQLLKKLKSKDELAARQQRLAQTGGGLETTGSGGDQVDLRVGERIGEGTFCVVFRAELIPKPPGLQRSKQVAVKFELRENDSTQLRNEFRIYRKFSHCPGVAKIYSFGEINFHKVLVMDLLGPSLESYFNGCGRRFSVKTVCMLAKQMVTRVQMLHEHKLIYRDIKPENFLMGLPGSPTEDLVYMIDYGMAKAYRDENDKHISYGEAQSLSGTARYMSINAHCRRTQSRRDDLEALGHVFMYFVRGSLPWQGAKALQNDQRYDQMCQRKQATSIEDLCRGYPAGFSEYLQHTRGLAFEDDPDYDYLRSLFDKILEEQGDVDDQQYDWRVKPARNDSVSPLPPQPPAHAPSTSTPILLPAAGPPGDNQTTPAQTVPTLHKPTDNRALPAESKSAAAARPVTPQKPISLQRVHADANATAVPASPPGIKRDRSEFVSELQPPTRSRPKKATKHIYDGDAQMALADMYKGVKARRYEFHRAVKQSRAAVPALLGLPGLPTMEGAAGLPGLYHRPVPSARATGPPIVSPAFTEQLDKTLTKVVKELEALSDRMLQDGDWSGATRVAEWIAEIEEAAKKEIERVRAEADEEKKQQAAQVPHLAGTQGLADVLRPPEPDRAPLYPVIPSTLGQPGPLPTAMPDRRVPVTATVPASADLQAGSYTHIDMNSLDPLEVDDELEADDEMQVTEMDIRARFANRRAFGYGAGGFPSFRRPPSQFQSTLPGQPPSQPATQPASQPVSSETPTSPVQTSTLSATAPVFVPGSAVFPSTSASARLSTAKAMPTTVSGAQPLTLTPPAATTDAPSASPSAPQSYRAKGPSSTPPLSVPSIPAAAKLLPVSKVSLAGPAAPAAPAAPTLAATEASASATPSSAGLHAQDRATATVRSGIKDLTLNGPKGVAVDDHIPAGGPVAADHAMVAHDDGPIAVDDDAPIDVGDDEGDVEVMELVYRTASGTRRVMRIPQYG